MLRDYVCVSCFWTLQSKLLPLCLRSHIMLHSHCNNLAIFKALERQGLRPIDAYSRLPGFLLGSTIDLHGHTIARISEKLTTRIDHVVTPLPALSLHERGPSTLYSSHTFITNPGTIAKFNALSNGVLDNRPRLGRRHIQNVFQDTHFDRFEIFRNNGVLLRFRSRRRGLWEVLRKVEDCRLDDRKDSVLEDFEDSLYQVAITQKTPVLDIFLKRDGSPKHLDSDN